MHRSDAVERREQLADPPRSRLSAAAAPVMGLRASFAPRAERGRGRGAGCARRGGATWSRGGGCSGSCEEGGAPRRWRQVVPPPVAVRVPKFSRSCTCVEGLTLRHGYRKPTTSYRCWGHIHSPPESTFDCNAFQRSIRANCLRVITTHELTRRAQCVWRNATNAHG